jgi:hypothetical protein
VGQTGTIDGTQLEVIGVLESLTSSDDASNNDLAVVPFSTMSRRLVGGGRPVAGAPLEAQPPRIASSGTSFFALLPVWKASPFASVVSLPLCVGDARPSRHPRG